LSNEFILKTFLDAADAWVCDGYSIDLRFLANVAENKTELWDASVTLTPLPAQQDLGFQINTAGILVGQIQCVGPSKKELIAVLADASDGMLRLSDRVLSLSKEHSYFLYSDMSQRERWFSELHLQVNGGPRPVPSPMELANVDSALRLAAPPFDGLTDVAGWLGLRAPGSTANSPAIAIRVSPPVDLIFAGCSLADEELLLTLHAHPQFDVSRVALSVRAVPGVAIGGRRQIAHEIQWGGVHDGRLVGTVRIRMQQADQVLAMLMIETSTVRRHWFSDPKRARNSRLLAIQHFDGDLKKIRQSVLDSSESLKFEKGVAALLFLLGFNPSLTLETDGPDIVVTTPNGRLVIVECTTRIADFASKLGKLVDRRGSLSKSLVESGHSPQVFAMLVCRLPRNQIAAQESDLRIHNTILVAGEDLAEGLNRIRNPDDADQWLDRAALRISGDSVPGLN